MVFDDFPIAFCFYPRVGTLLSTWPFTGLRIVYGRCTDNVVIIGT